MKKLSLKDIKSWSVEIEKKITEEWKESELFNFDDKKTNKIYSIDTPPPYVNFPIHIGQAITYCYMDFFARYKRAKGFSVIFPLGLDRNGLPIEIATEKKFNASPFKIGREKFIELCKKLIDESSEETADTFKKLGISFTSYKQGEHIGAVYLTDSPEYRALTQSTFISLFKKGMIYEDTRITNWDPVLQTAIADSEIEYKDLPATFNDIVWRVKETGEKILIGTTRPELIGTCGMVIYNPADTRYNHLNEKTAVSPLFNRAVPIKPHPLAQIDKGTGLVMMCSAGDLSDIQFFREQKLKPLIAINKDGKMNDNAGFLSGLKVKEARQSIIEKLKENSLLTKQSKITHRTPISERSGAEIEFIEMPEFYLKQIEFKDEIRKIAGKINFFPQESKKILLSWLDSISIDWPISRRRYYATPIPLWNSGDLIALPPAGKYCEPWKESPPKDSEVLKNGKLIGKISDFKNITWKGEERVFDTWMDSSISELYILKYQIDNSFFKKAFPATLRPQGKEIVRTWLYYTLLRGFLETKNPAFRDVWIHQHIVDAQGRKMSKSLGNMIDPQELIRNYGSEAIRLWAATEGDLSKQDLPCSREKISAELKTMNKILNVARFIMQFDKPKSKINPTNLDKLFTAYIENLTHEAEECYEKYDFHHPSQKLRRFLWEIFASHYIELVKSRAYNKDNSFKKEESDSAKFNLYFMLERFLALIYPIIPQISSTIAIDLGIDLLYAKFPEAKREKTDLSLIDKLMDFNKEVWKTKKDNGISLNSPIKDVKIPKEFKQFERDLKACHKIE